MPPPRASPKGLLRALRHVLVVLSLHACLACRWERDLWLEANGRTRVLLLRHLRHDVGWWPVPGVDRAVFWDEAALVSASVAAQMLDVWAPWAWGRLGW
ncbi:hypothetical protein CDD83_10702 [Cordyceps sp. RAO-2017]|nr:hypothetical protein CDD83_10702 [Cordyceps sp. RAO-2017]